MYQNFLYASYIIVLDSTDKINNGKNKSGNHTTTQQTGKATRQVALALVVGRKICGDSFNFIKSKDSAFQWKKNKIFWLTRSKVIALTSEQEIAADNDIWLTRP